MAKSRIHSILTALPVLMLVIGLYIYYRAEQAQVGGEPLLDQIVEFEGTFNGLSTVGAEDTGQHYLWLASPARNRGARIDQLWYDYLRRLDPPLQTGERLHAGLAPTVDGSTTLWLVSLTRGDLTLHP